MFGNSLFLAETIISPILFPFRKMSFTDKSIKGSKLVLSIFTFIFPLAIPFRSNVLLPGNKSKILLMSKFLTPTSVLKFLPSLKVPFTNSSLWSENNLKFLIRKSPVFFRYVIEWSSSGEVSTLHVKLLILRSVGSNFTT